MWVFGEEGFEVGKKVSHNLFASIREEEPEIFYNIFMHLWKANCTEKSTRMKIDILPMFMDKKNQSIREKVQCLQSFVLNHGIMDHLLLASNFCLEKGG